MQRILIAVDGSDHANAAIDLAARLVQGESSLLLLAHVVTQSPPSNAARDIVAVEYPDELMSRTRRLGQTGSGGAAPVDARTFLDQHAEAGLVVNTLVGERILELARERLLAAGASNVDTALLRGDPVRALLALAAREQIDTIVMGCRGTGTLHDLLLGSVSQSLAHAASQRVIMVK